MLSPVSLLSLSLTNQNQGEAGLMVSKLSIITDETLTLAVTDMPVNNDLTAKQVTKMMSLF